MSKWKCEICGKEFDNFQAQGFDNKVYCPLCFFREENKRLNKKWDKLKRKIKDEIGKTYDLTTEDYREERKYIITTYKYVLYLMKELDKAKENK